MARDDRMKTSLCNPRPSTHPVCKILHTGCVEKVKEIRADGLFCYRYRLEDSELLKSIKAFGMLMPVVITNAARPVLLAGHKRFFAAQALKMKKIPVQTVEAMEPQDAFLLNLVSNWKQECSEMDRARALEKAAHEFYFNEKDILSVVMPLLGLPEDKALPENYRKAGQFAPSFKDLVEEGPLFIRAVLPFLKFSKDDQDYFARNIGTRMKLTSSQMYQVGEWLLDLMKKTGKPLRFLCEGQKLLTKLSPRNRDLRTKADLFFARVKRLRFPGYSLFLKEFGERRAEILLDAKEIRLEPVQGFEEPGFELHARVKTPEALDRLLRKLAAKRSSLNSLFEIAM